MGRDVKGVAIISLLFGVFAVITNGSPSGILFMGMFIGGAIWLFYER